MLTIFRDREAVCTKIEGDNVFIQLSFGELTTSVTKSCAQGKDFEVGKQYTVEIRETKEKKKRGPKSQWSSVMRKFPNGDQEGHE